MQRNKAMTRPRVKTHEGAPAFNINDEQLLRRSVMACFLWEKEFYEDGEMISNRIQSLVPKVKPEKVAQIAIEAREKMKLRHAPLFIVREMARHESHRPFVAETLARVIKRADEPTEFLAMYWDDKKQPIAHSVRKGLTEALRKFDEYQLGKYREDNKAIKQRDVFRIVRPKPANEEQAALWGRAVKGELATPDTWEVALSANDGLSKKEKWERLLSENKLGGLALLRNLRNFDQNSVNPVLIRAALKEANVRWVLPFRFIAAARFAPKYEPELEQKLFESVADKPKLPGKTVFLVDVSGSMDAAMSYTSDMKRVDAACGMAMVGRELSDDAVIYSFSNNVKIVPTRRGFALRDAIVRSQSHGGTELGRAVTEVWAKERPDRLIVITDEQSHDRVTYPSGLEKGYMINVASNRNGVGYGQWTHIDGFSESIFSYILEVEGLADSPVSEDNDD